MIDQEPSGSRASVLGRDAELGFLRDVVVNDAGGRTIVLVGGPGIGKTTLWEAGLRIARGVGVRVLAARPSGSGAQLAFAALIDLCDAVGGEDMADVPPPQRFALEVALLRAEPTGGSVRAPAVALGFVNAVRALAARERVLVAIDDVQWLDPSSAEVLVFAARRLLRSGVLFVLARRPGRATGVERALGLPTLERVALAPLSVGAVRRLLLERLGLTVSRQLLRRIMEVTEGNPLFALEVGRLLVERGVPSLTEEIPLGESVEQMLGTRVASLPPSVRRLLLAVALSEEPRVDQLRAIDASALDEALDAGVVVVDGRRIRPSHPLLAAAAQRRSRPRERRELHLALAGAAREERARATHLALAARGEEPKLAARVAAAAEDACARGARRQALLVAEHALRLTPAEAAERPERVLGLAERLDDAGELRRLAVLLQREMPALRAGGMRARAWLLLSETEAVGSIHEQDGYLERALSEGGKDRNVRAYVLAKRAANAAAGAVAGLRRAHAWALAALREADEPSVQRFALYALAWPRALRGHAIDDLCERSGVASDPASYISASPERVAGKRLFWRGELEGARALLGSLAALADERGELTSYAMLRLHLCELELRAGDWDAAAALLDEWAESSDYEAQFRPQYQRCRALLAAGRGDPDAVERWAGEAIDRATAVGCRWDELEARRARGIAALLARAPERALAELWAVWEHCEREGVLDPGAFPVAPELVEALVELDRLADARAVTERLARLARRQGHSWALASVERCRALTRPGSAHAVATLCAAANELGRLGLRFDAARSLLAAGRMQRRAKRWRAARDSLAEAAAEFDRLGSPGWANLARAEQARVGGRRPRPAASSPQRSGRWSSSPRAAWPTSRSPPPCS